jgi:hypothetical protein
VGGKREREREDVNYVAGSERTERAVVWKGLGDKKLVGKRLTASMGVHFCVSLAHAIEREKEENTLELGTKRKIRRINFKLLN